MSTMVPDAITPVRGYRAWAVRDGKLNSTGRDYVWKSGQNDAICLNGVPMAVAVAPVSGITIANCVIESPKRRRWWQRKRAAEPYAISTQGRPLLITNCTIRGPVTIQMSGAQAGATAPSPSHAAPAKDCSCGFYALTSRPQIMEPNIVGVIEGWGRVQMHKHGWRAEHAQIVGLCDPGPNCSETYRSMLSSVAYHYNVPILSAEGEL